jgi:hypothetical protein
VIIVPASQNSIIMFGDHHKACLNYIWLWDLDLKSCRISLFEGKLSIDKMSILPKWKQYQCSVIETETEKQIVKSSGRVDVRAGGVAR